jgi:hypothetical protein
MIEFFLSGGYVMWPMAAVASGVLYLSARAALRIRRDGAGEDGVQRDMHAILFWGVMATLLGALGTASGVAVMARAAAMAGGAEAALIWGGVSMALVSLVFGVAVFIAAALLWFLLRLTQARKLAGERTRSSCPAV